MLFGETADRPFTFAEASDGEGFATRVMNRAGEAELANSQLQRDSVDAGVKAVKEGVDLTPYAYRSTYLNDLFNSKIQAREESYDAVIDAVKKYRRHALQSTPSRAGQTRHLSDEHAVGSRFSDRSRQNGSRF